MAELSIGDVAERVGVATSTIRYYESIGLLSEPERVSGRRRYDPAVFQRLAFIQFAKRAGFTLAEIETLLHGADPQVRPSERWRVLAEEKLGEIDVMIRQAQEMKRLLLEGLKCGCLTLDDCQIIETQGCIVDKDNGDAAPRHSR